MTRLAAERLLLALLALVAAALLPEATSYKGGSQYFPTVLLVLLGVLCLVALWRTRRPRSSADSEPFFVHAGRFALALGLVAGYIAALPHVGYFTCSAVLIAVMAWLLGYRDGWKILATIVGYLAFVWVVFQGIFQREMAREFFMPWILGY
jgi:cell division protein FtsW (lipid II flippase)